MLKIPLIICLFTTFLVQPLIGQQIVIDSLLAQVRDLKETDSLDLNRFSILQNVFDLSKESVDQYRLEEACAGLGDYFFKYGLYEQAIGYYSYVLPKSTIPAKKSKYLINIHRKIGQSYSNLGQPDSAFFYYNKIFEEFEFPERLAILRDIVEIYTANSQHEKSLEYNLQIEQLLTENNAPDKELSKIYNNIGYNYHRLNHYENSIIYFESALNTSHPINDEEKASILSNLGISHYSQGNYKKSLEFLNRAFLLSTHSNQRAEVGHLIATVYMANKDYLRAISFYERSYQLAGSAQNYKLQSRIYSGLANVYNATHEYDLAFEYFKSHSRLLDSLDFAEQINQKRILDNQKYIEKTEKENRLLKANRDFQKLQIEKLETESRNQTLRNNALLADSIQRVNELSIERQKNELALTTEENNKLTIARQENLIKLTNQQLEISRANAENDRIEKEKQQKETELAQEKLIVQERNASLLAEQNENEQNTLEIARRKTNQRNMAIIAGLLAGLAIFAFWAYRSKRKDNVRISTAYDNLAVAKNQLQTAEIKIKSLLKQQVSGAVAEALITNIDSAVVEKRFVTIMFLDIRNFTAYCEGRSPSEIIHYQNSVFGFMIDIIDKHHGVVNQMMGDGFMATFGAPLSTGNDCLNAYRSAHEITTTLKHKIASRKIIPTKIGIGLHAGNVVTGNVGNDERQQYSITGNTVILAARLEQLNKEFGTSIVYSKKLYDSIPEDERDPNAHFKSVMVKGRSRPIQVCAI